MADNKFALKVMCPDRTFFEGEADMVEMNTTEGYIGVYPGHIPIATVLAPGILVRLFIRGLREYRRITL